MGSWCSSAVVSQLRHVSLQTPPSATPPPQLRPGCRRRHRLLAQSFDGGSRGNPGLAGAAAVLQDSQGRELAVLQASLPFGCTNNEAEYAGLCMGLMGLQYLSAAGRVCRIVGDSQLVIRQVWDGSVEGQGRVGAGVHIALPSTSPTPFCPPPDR
eukprot:350844-Chlamydomonas_euryale.AAC.1